MAAPRTDFGSWFSSAQGDLDGSISTPAAAPAAPPEAATPSVGGFFATLFSGGATPSATPAAGDVESGQAETSSFLASARQSVGALLGLAPAAPPEDDWTCGLTTFQRLQLALVLGGGAAVLFMLAFFIFLPSENK